MGGLGRQASGLNPGLVKSICEILLTPRRLRPLEEALSSVECSLSPNLVDSVVKTVKEVNVESALAFVRWAGQHHGLVASSDCYSRLVSSLARAYKFPVVWEVMEEMDKLAYVIHPASFATLIQSYGRVKMVDEAVAAFDRMPEFMCRQNYKAYVALINVLVESGQHARALSVYHRMRDKGLVPSASLCTTVLHGLGASGDVEAAAAFVDHLRESGWDVNTPMYNALMQGFVKAGNSEALYKTFVRIRSKADALTYNLVLAECCKAGHLLGGALDVYMEMVSKGLLANSDFIRDLVSGLCSGGFVEEAFKVVMVSKARANASAYNIVINALCKRGECEQAMMLFEDMKSFQVAPTAVTYNTLIDGLCKVGRVDASMKLFKEMQQSSAQCRPDKYTYNALIDGLCAAERLDDAFALLRGTESGGYKANIVNKNTLVNGICKQIIAERERREFGRHGLKVFQEGVAHSCAVEEAWLALLYACLEYMFGSNGKYRPTQVTYSIIVHFLCRASKVVEAAKVWKAMKQRFPNVDAVTYNSFLYGLVQRGDVDEARRLFDEIEDPTMISHSLVLDAYLKSGDFSMGYQVYEEMLKRGFCVDEVVYNIILSGLSRAKRTTQMGEVCADMLNNGIRPSQNSYSILINALCSEGRLEAATQILDTMKERGCMPDVVTYNTVLHHLCKNDHLEEAVKLFREMKHHCGYDPGTWNIMIHGIVQLRGAAAAEPIFLELIRDGFFPEYITGQLFMDRVRQVELQVQQQRQQTETEETGGTGEEGDEKEGEGGEPRELLNVKPPKVEDDLSMVKIEDDNVARQQRSLLAFGYSRIVGFFVD